MLKACIPCNKAGPSPLVFSTALPASPAELSEAKAPDIDGQGAFDEEAAIAVAENASPLVCINPPSDEQVAPADDALLLPLYPIQGWVRVHSRESVPSPVTPNAACPSKGTKHAHLAGEDMLALPSFPWVFSPSSPADNLPSLSFGRSPSGDLTLCVLGGCAAHSSSAPPALAFAEEALAAFQCLTTGHDLLDPSVHTQVHLAFQDHAAWFDVEAHLPTSPPRSFPPLPLALPVIHNLPAPSSWTLLPALNLGVTSLGVGGSSRSSAPRILPAAPVQLQGNTLPKAKAVAMALHNNWMVHIPLSALIMKSLLWLGSSTRFQRDTDQSLSVKKGVLIVSAPLLNSKAESDLSVTDWTHAWPHLVSMIWHCLPGGGAADIAEAWLTHFSNLFDCYDFYDNFPCISNMISRSAKPSSMTIPSALPTGRKRFGGPSCGNLILQFSALPASPPIPQLALPFRAHPSSTGAAPLPLSKHASV
ncbi:hypothetical protein BDR04DRAFT_1151845 [Suillus decipiens]|nr:hypothetical protein BDR04DRAFT_1151845 [Suillus decipiens]